MAELIYSTKETYTSYLKGRIFKIPEYQRGYKWSEKQINQLINDINGFDTNEGDDLFYCLQNITLYPSSLDKNTLHVVDGQQRLTTTYLLLCYLCLEEHLKGRFVYAVRESSNKFIQKIQQERNTFIASILSFRTFEDFCNAYPSEDFDHQDIFYMYSAVQTFDQSFKEQKINIDSFKEKFTLNVKFIVNEIHANIKEQELFMNLNTGKVPLDGADLVRAIIITRVAKEEMVSFRYDSIKDIVRLNEKRTRIGWELDQLNQWWGKNDVRDFFKPFAKIELDSHETIQFNDSINPINILYKLWASTKIKNKEALKLRLFENSTISSLELYRELVFLNRTLVDWFLDGELYHYLGYLANNQDTFSFKKYFDYWNIGNVDRNQFVAYLKDEIKQTVFGEENSTNSGFDYWSEQILNFDGENKANWYDSNKLEQFLILLDVIEISLNYKNKSKVQFLSATHFRKSNEDKEHIYPCTPKNIREFEKNKGDVLAIKAYLSRLNLDREDLFLHDEKSWIYKSDVERDEILKDLEVKIHHLTPINAIGNLVLLHYSINRGFGNDYYKEKRASVVNNVHNGEYVRQHTLNVFVKGRSAAKDLNDWTFDDIKNNCIEIDKTLRSFFNMEPIVYENESVA